MLHPPRSRRVPPGAVALALAAGWAAACAPGPAGPLVPPVAVTDVETGAPVDPLARADGPVVFIFTRTDCPISNRYAPEIQRLAQAYRPRGVRFYLVYVDPDQTSAEIAAHRREYGLDVPALRDPHHDLVAATGASVTPEAVVVSPERRRIYRGRIDDRFPAYGKARVAPRRRDLAGAIDAALGGRRASPSTTEAVGCLIDDLAPAAGDRS